MADKPSRALVVYGDGFAPLVNPSHSHLHSLAFLSSCGFLSLRSSPASSPSEHRNDREIQEFAQLADAYDYYISQSKDGDGNTEEPVEPVEKKIPKICQRFMGLRAALVSSGPSICSFANELGITVLEIDELVKQDCDSKCRQRKFDSEDFLTSKLLALLGFSDGEVKEKNEYDLVFLHIKAGENIEVLKDKMNIKTDVGWLNNLASKILQNVKPGSQIASRLHLSFVLSYGKVDEKDATSCSILNAATKINSDLSLLRPRQSYTMKGGKVLDDVRHHHPFLICQWQEAVTRRDLAREFSFNEFEKRGGNCTILADRFLHEVAFKLWKAPKYGA